VSKVDILVAGRLPPPAAAALEAQFNVHRYQQGSAPGPAAGSIRGLARGHHLDVTRALLAQFPAMEIVANFGVGYDGIDLAYAAERGIVVTNTPDVLTEEVADTTLGLLLMTVRELSAAERYLREGGWEKAAYPLTHGTMRDRTVGIAGLGRIGLAVARRLDAMGVPVVYHTRNPRPDVAYRHYPDLTAMARDVDTLINVLPANETTHRAINAGVLAALGPRGVFINIGRGATVDDPALIAALRDRTIMAAGLDVFTDEPHVPAELMALPNVVLLPHVGSASVYTRAAMGQLVVDNLVSWFQNGRPLTPVPETPWPPKR
jgi:lactate dehydrogenase-like 2-hydroxyacid dehydrogenase